MLVGLAGAAISLAALPFASVGRASKHRMFLAGALLLLHVAAATAYYFYVQENSADTALYYFDKYHIGERPLTFGTTFVVHFTQFLKNVLGGGYFECFIFFQSIGFWGIVILMRVFQEIHIKIRSDDKILPYYILFLPSLHFWTSAIGKDAPVFFAISLCVWCVLSLRRRVLLFGFSLFVMVLFRAHVALIVVTTIAAAAAIHPRIPAGHRAGLLSLTLLGAAVLTTAVQDTLGLNLADLGAVQTFLIEEDQGGFGSDLGSAPFAVRLLSLLFRPLFFDVQSAMGIIASVENVGSILLLAYFVKNWRSVRFLSKRVFFIQFCIIFSVGFVILLALVYYNVGLGLRQRVMVFPALFSVFVAHWAMPRRRAHSGFRHLPEELLRKRPRAAPSAGL